MRLVLSLSVLAMTACSVDRDAANEQMTIQYNQQRMRDTAVQAGQAARNFAAGAGNVAAATGRAVKNEVGDVDVDVNVRRTPTQNRQ